MGDDGIPRTEQADVAIRDLVGVADRAQPQRAARHRFLDVVHRRQAVAQAAGQDHGVAMPAPTAFVLHLESAGRASQRGHRGLLEGRAVDRRLLAHARQQGGAGDALGKAWAVVGLGDPARAAVAGIQHQASPVQASQVGGRCQSGGPPADHEYIHRCVPRRVHHIVPAMASGHHRHAP